MPTANCHRRDGRTEGDGIARIKAHEVGHKGDGSTIEGDITTTSLPISFKPLGNGVLVILLTFVFVEVDPWIRGEEVSQCFYTALICNELCECFQLIWFGIHLNGRVLVDVEMAIETHGSPLEVEHIPKAFCHWFNSPPLCPRMGLVQPWDNSELIGCEYCKPSGQGGFVE